MRAPSVVAQLSAEARRIQAERPNMLLKQLHNLRYLLRQGFPIRGHKDGEGNLVQLLEMQSTNCPQLKHWIHDAHYLSNDIINEMVSQMGNTLLRQLLMNVRAVRWFSIMDDETRDVCNTEQLSIVIQWVDND